MITGTYFGFAAAGTALAAGWSYVQGILNRARSLVVVNVILQDEAANAMQHLVWNKFRRSPIGDSSL